MKLYDFFAEWCGPCKLMHPIVAEFSKKHPEVDVIKVNSEHEPELCDKYKIRNLPTFVVLDDDNKVITKKTGAMSLEALEQLCFS